jgi:hypothetical protein
MKMYMFSVHVDAEFLATLPPDKQDDVIKDIEEYFGEGSCADCYIRICPYCNVLSAFLRSGKVIESDIPHPACTHCGGSTPFEKCRQIIKKAKILFHLSAYYPLKEDSGTHTEEKRVLQEQCLILLGSGMEMFLHEFYGICMDVTFVKPEFSLYKKHTGDTRYNLRSYDDIIDQFKAELKMDLPAIIGNDLIQTLHLLELKRDAIVYKNGHADIHFLNRSGIQGKVGSQIPLSPDEVAAFINASGTVIDIIEKEWRESISRGARDRITSRLTRSLADLTFEMPVSRH